MNKIIHSQLMELFYNNFKKLENATFEIMIEDFIQGMGENLQEKGLLDDPLYNEDVLNLVKHRENQELINAFENAKKLDLDEKAIKQKLTIDIKKSIHELNQTVFSKNEDIKKHSLYIVIGSEHDPYNKIYTKGYLSGFTEDEDLFLNEVDPLQYMQEDQKNTNEIYSDIGFIDFLPILKNLATLESLLKKYELHDILLCTATYSYLRSSYEYKLYLLLNEIFEDIRIEFFHSKAIVKPLYIYALEFLGERINVYIYD
ncbi:hypothetical protein H2O64_20915 [Kordia sp. YSTF-M3]|uniref:Uncharacterized protein n=1 Tax=Kordia aestuariivivens TaxID=2759037 RepID=A0ABR7QFR3_9FLAO|nr:hypothetical protein [Kordia aestuariivivens]MBC8757144.1 hypothetical protein [Kordia aestuariivivens]